MTDILLELKEANRRANLIIGQQADEAKALQDKIDELEKRDEVRGNYLMDRSGYFAAMEQKLASRIAALESELQKFTPTAQ